MRLHVLAADPRIDDTPARRGVQGLHQLAAEQITGMLTSDDGEAERADRTITARPTLPDARTVRVLKHGSRPLLPEARQ